MADGLLGWLGDFLGLNKGQATQDAATKNAALLDQLQQTGGSIYGQANDINQNLLGEVGKGANLYSDALGINGATGNANAVDAFHVSPGYQFGVDQGTRALMRTAAARGEVGGGGLGIDLAKYVTGTANNEFGNWLDRLGGFQQQLPGATAQATGALDTLGQFNSDITSGRMASNNQAASGQEASQGGLWNLLGNVAGVAGAGIGAATGLKKLGQPAPTFTGYGTY